MIHLGVNEIFKNLLYISIYSYNFLDSSPFFPLLVTAIPEQNYNPATLMPIPHKDKISVLMIANSRIVLKVRYVTVFVHTAFVLCSTGDSA